MLVPGRGSTLVHASKSLRADVPVHAEIATGPDCSISLIHVAVEE